MAFLTLMEIIEDRFAVKSTIIGSQLPLEKWYEAITEKSIAVLDKLFNSSHKIILKRESMRRKKTLILHLPFLIESLLY